MSKLVLFAYSVKTTLIDHCVTVLIQHLTFSHYHLTHRNCGQLVIYSIYVMRKVWVLRNPWIVLREVVIDTLHKNPWIV